MLPWWLLLILFIMCKIMGIEKSSTTPYQASGNGMTERFNRIMYILDEILMPF